MSDPGRTRRLGRPAAADGARTRSRVLRSAVRLLATSGYAGLSLEDVASEVGITRGGLYRYFASKQALVRAAVLESSPGIEVVQAYYEIGSAGARCLADRLRAFVLACVQQTFDDPEPTVRFYELGAFAEHDPVLAQLYRERSRWVRDRVRALVADAVADGELGGDVEPEHVVDAVLGLIWALSKGAATAPNQRTREQLVRACDLILQTPSWTGKRSNG